MKSIGTDEDKFVEILTARSPAHLQAVFAEYKKVNGLLLLSPFIPVENDKKLNFFFHFLTINCRVISCSGKVCFSTSFAFY